MKEWISDILHKGFMPQLVFAHHIQMAKRNMLRGDICTNRDFFVMMQDILNVSCKIEDFSFHTNVHDVVSVHNWVKS